MTGGRRASALLSSRIGHATQARGLGSKILDPYPAICGQGFDGMNTTRVLHLEGVHNFRDFGGYSVAGGLRLRRGFLWRSGQHHEATDADLEKIAALDLASVFDLRTSTERERHPCRRPEGFAAPVVTAPDPEIAHAPHLAAARPTRQRSGADTREALRRNYGRMCFRPELQGMIRRYIAELAQGRGPSLVNCMAGKDLTGIAVAMVQLAAGVHRDDVVADYLLTNEAGDPEARIAAGARTIAAISGPLSEEVLRVVMAVEAEYLETALDAITAEHGSIDAYLAGPLGADAALRERLRGALVE